MSAIDWLSKSVAMPAGRTGRPTGKADVATGAAPAAISTLPLDAPRIDAVGVLPTSVTGLPRGLWGATPTATLADMIARMQVSALPAVQDLLYTLLMAELDPPFDATGDGQLFLARVDKLLALGALEQADALLEIAGTDTPQAFRRWFDVALLTGDEARACAAIRTRPDIAPTFPARVFCLARSGDWTAAALSLRTGEALGFVSQAEADLMTHFLDPALLEQDGPLPPPQPITPLTWRLLEAIGEPIPTNTLPVAFAQADLGPTAGWKAQIEAAERLARLGAIPGNQLWGLYTRAAPSASGGVWERVRALRAFERALVSTDPPAAAAATLADALAAVWPLMQAADLEVPFAELYGTRLQGKGLTGDAARLAFEIGLLSADYEEIAAAHTPTTPREAFLRGLARGDTGGVILPDTMARAIARGLAARALPPDQALPPDMTDLVTSDRLGEALLRAMDALARGAAGDPAAVPDAIALLQRVGLQDTLRRSALQLMLLDRRG
ncbi:hypothetical protein ABIE69_000569 [Rhodobacteraceae bacterium MBR-64]